MAMNWVDLLIVAFLIIFAVDAFGRSLALEILDLVSFLLALILSFRFYNYPADLFKTWFNIPPGLSFVIGFMIVWFLTETIFFIAVRILLPRVPKIDLPIEKYLAVIPAILRYWVFASLILVVIATFPVQPVIKKGVQDSKLGSAILGYAYGLEQPVKNVFGGVSDETLSFLTIKPKTDERINLGFSTSEITVDENAEYAMIDLVNKERASRGLKTLKYDETLRRLGRDHSKDMFIRGYFSHYTPENEDVADRSERYDINYMVIGENLAYAPNLELAHKGLMNSEGHRANILSPDFNKIGIGVYDGGIYGKMFTQVFSN
jgi:uncharacterized protein YkwD